MAVFLLAMPPIDGCTTDQEVHEMKTQDSNKQEIAVVEQYVTLRKGWSPSDYKIEKSRRESRYIVYLVTYLADQKLPYPGGGKSFEAYYDPATHKVVKEMRFQ
jgi:hypothetical protein